MAGRGKQQREQREKVTLETPIPEVPKKKVPAPSKKEFEEKVSQIDKQIQDIKDAQNEASTSYQTKKEGQKQDPRAKVDLQSNITEKRRLHEQKEKLKAELEALRETFRRGVEENKKIKPKIKNMNEQDMDKAIKETQRKMETTSISLQEEKRMLNELKELEAAKPLCQQYFARNIILNENKQKQEVIKKQLDEIWKKIEEIQGQIQSVKQLQQSQQEKQQAEYPEMQKKREEDRNTLNQLYEQRRQIQNDFKEKEYAYKEQQNLIQRRDFIIEKQKQLREREERRKKFEEEQKELENLNPWWVEISYCEQLIIYIQRILPQQAEAQQEEVKQVEKKEYGERVLSKKELEEQELLAAGWGGKQKKKKQQVQKKQQKEAINHTIEILNLFNKLEIKAPNTQTEVSQTLQQIQEKKTFYEQNPDKKQKQVKQEKQERQEKEPEEEAKVSIVEKKETTQGFNTSDFPTL